jgi:hypothetical protein
MNRRKSVPCGYAKRVVVRTCGLGEIATFGLRHLRPEDFCANTHRERTPQLLDMTRGISGQALRNERRRLHATVFDVLSHATAATGSSDSAVLGHHAFEAERFSDAADFLSKAGDRPIAARRTSKREICLREQSRPLTGWFRRARPGRWRLTPGLNSGMRFLP